MQGELKLEPIRSQNISQELIYLLDLKPPLSLHCEDKQDKADKSGDTMNKEANTKDI